jgi:dienelactone hydrolase
MERLMKAAILCAGLLAFGISGAVQGQGDMTPEARKAMQAANAAYNAMPDTLGNGRYPAVKLTDPRLPEHLVYRPADLGALGGRKLGVLVWGNGGCSDDAASARLHLAEIASQGYVVIAPGRVLSGPGAPAQPDTPPPPGPLGIKTNAAQVSAGIDWALAENSRRGSALYHRINPKMVAVSGHSCGGLQAIELAADRRVGAVIIHNSGVFKDGSNPIRGISIAKSALGKLHTPILYVMGGPSDIAWPNGNDDFDRIDRVPAAIVSLNVGHGGTFHDANGGKAAQVDVAWLEWQLRHDATAGRWFRGANCVLCTDAAWTIRKKRID